MSLSPFHQALGEDWSRLPATLQAFHGKTGARVYRGQADIARGNHPLARLVAWLFGFPPAGQAVPVKVTVTPDGDGEIWARQFGSHHFHSRLTCQGPGIVVERFGPFAFALPIDLTENGLSLPVATGEVMGIPLPKALLPRSDAVETATAEGFEFDIRLSLPLLGPMVHYQGDLAPEKESA
ncbi:MAG: DUF4166 domain-containing protein [Pseudomonadota bacterium]